MLMASGYFYMSKEKMEMIINKCEANESHFGNVDLEHCNILLGFINYILRINYGN